MGGGAVLEGGGGQMTVVVDAYDILLALPYLRLWAAFQARYGDSFATAGGQHYACPQATVTLVGLAEVVPHFAQGLGNEEDCGGDADDL